MPQGRTPAQADRAGSYCTGLKMHGGVAPELIKEPNMEGLKEGIKNLDKHIENLQSFGQTVVVAFNRYANDTDEELDFVRCHCEEIGVALPSTTPSWKVVTVL